MAIRKLLVLIGVRRGELPAGDTIASLPLEPTLRASLPDPTKVRGQVFMTDDGAGGLTIAWSNGTRYVRPASLAIVSLTL